MHIWKPIWCACRSTTNLLSSCKNLASRKWFDQFFWQQYRSSSNSGMKVTICGAAGCTGQPLALLLKQCPSIDELALYDQCNTCGFGLELSHVDTKCKVCSYSGKHLLCDALKGAKVVVVVVRDRMSTFESSSPLIAEIALQICNVCPTCFTVVATEPIESMVPLIGEIQRLRGVYNPRKLLGSVELNCVRANTVIADFLRVPPESVRVPVIGGATPCTMVPVLSHAIHPGLLTQDQIECLTACILGGTETVCEAKCCQHATPCLAGAFAIARNTINVVKGLLGQKITQCAYSDCLGTCAPDCQYFACDVILGPSGIEKHIGVPELTKFENCLLYNALPYIQNEIWRALWLVYTMCEAPCSPAQSRNPPSPACWCFSPPICPCVPSGGFVCGGPDTCRDHYLASICREMTCKCGGTQLCWRPKETEFDSARASNIKHQIPMRGPSCDNYNEPSHVRIEKQIIERSKNPPKCMKKY